MRKSVEEALEENRAEIEEIASKARAEEHPLLVAAVSAFELGFEADKTKTTDPFNIAAMAEITGRLHAVILTMPEVPTDLQDLYNSLAEGLKVIQKAADKKIRSEFSGIFGPELTPVILQAEDPSEERLTEIGVAGRIAMNETYLGWALARKKRLDCECFVCFAGEYNQDRRSRPEAEKIAIQDHGSTAAALAAFGRYIRGRASQRLTKGIAGLSSIDEKAAHEGAQQIIRSFTNKGE